MKLPKFKFRWPLSRPLTLILLIVAIYLVTAGFFVYKKPESRFARFSASFLPYPAALTGINIVPVRDVFAQEGYVRYYSQKTNQVVPEPQKVRSDVLDHLTEVSLVEAETGRFDIEVTSKDVDEAFDTLASQNGGKPQITTTLKELYGMDEKSFKKLIRDQLVIDKFKREVLVTVSVRHILVDDEGKAKEIAKKVREGADFAELAKTESKDTGSREAGGSLGYIGRGQTVKEFEDTAFSLAKDTISDPVKSQFGWHVIKVEDKKGSVDKTYADWLAEAKSKTKIVRLLTR